MKIVFFGTPDAAVPSLSSLLASEHDLAAVVTAPDRPRGRGMKVEASPVKRAALEARLQVIQPATLRSAEAKHDLRSMAADLFVVVAYGLILPGEILNIPSRGGVNVHFSLLPLLRGAAPVQRALIEGHDTTGVTVMQMDEGMDTGPILTQVEEPVQDSDDAGSLEERLARLGASLLLETLPALERGEVTPRPQDDSAATYAPKLSAGDARVDWSQPGARVRGQVRAFRPRPGAWTTWVRREPHEPIGGSALQLQRLKVWQVAGSDEVPEIPPGSLHVSGEHLYVGTASAPVEVLEIQPESKRKMSAAEFVRGYRPQTGEHFS